jgi:hypothetical protein
MPTREELAAHLQSDPERQGYADLIEAGAVEALWKLLHAPVPGKSVPPAALTAEELTPALDHGELVGLTAEQLRWLDFILARGSIAVTASLLVQLAEIGPTTRAAVEALLERPASPLDLAFGAGTAVPELQVVKALQTFDTTRYPAELAPPDAHGRELKAEVDGTLVPATTEHLADERIALKVVEPERKDAEGAVIEGAKVIPVKRVKGLDDGEVMRGNR